MQTGAIGQLVHCRFDHGSNVPCAPLAT